MATKRTDEFRADAVPIALTRKQAASDLTYRPPVREKVAPTEQRPVMH